MAQERYIVPQAVPRLTGNTRTDLEIMNRYLWSMVAELQTRLETAERKIRALEKRQQATGNRQ